MIDIVPSSFWHYLDLAITHIAKVQGEVKKNSGDDIMKPPFI